MSHPNLHVVTGANGFVGSNLVRALLCRGDRVWALARGPRDRLTACLDGASSSHGVPMSAAEHARLEHSQIDLDRPGLGLALTLPSERLTLWHAAAHMSFSQGDAEQSKKINVVGTRHLLDWFVDVAPPGSQICHISTAYVCGKHSGALPELLYPEADRHGFNNPYEQSKRQAEQIIAEHEASARFAIRLLRLGQVVGDSRTGHCTSDYGIYGFLKLIHALGQRGVQRLRVEADGATAFHLLTIDACVSKMLALYEAPVSHPELQISHLVPDQATSLETFCQSVRNGLGVHLDVRPVASLEPQELSPPERIVAKGIQSLGCYVRRVYAFETRPEVGRGLRINDAVLDRLLVAFGERLEGEADRSRAVVS